MKTCSTRLRQTLPHRRLHSTPSISSSRCRTRTLSLCPDCSRRSATLRPSIPHKNFLTPQCFHDLQAWLDTLLHDLTTMRDSPDDRARPQPFIRGQACF
eukprot:3286669-Pleurochrysis_carterae.AAC.1